MKTIYQLDLSLESTVKKKSVPEEFHCGQFEAKSFIDCLEYDL
jgi:hypothetical protein